MNPKTILIVEDEETLLRALEYSLSNEGYKVLTATDGAEGLALAQDSDPELLVLDIMLPTMDGLEICRAIRRDSKVPILFLTAKVDEVDKIVGLELGADDYMTKPFSMRELLARVKALLRRVGRADEARSDGRRKAIVASDGLELDPAGRTAEVKGELIRLRPKEFDLLVFLMKNRGIVFSRDTLLERVWGYDYAGDTRTVDVHLRWLRQKVEDDASTPRRLVTVRGVGYKFEG